MPTTSKYVFVQKNSNGQYTTYGGSVGKSTANANVNQVENFLILTTEPVTTNSHNNNINNNNNNNIITSSGVMATETPTKVSTNNHIHNNTTINSTTITGAGRTSGEHDDNELRPLAWLNDSNLIKGIVHSDNTGNNNNNNGNNNICIINAADAHELIEELPHHLAGEENVATTVISHVIDATHQKSDNKITKIKLKDNQQQLIDVLVNNNNHNISDNNNNANNLVVNDFQKQFIVNASKRVNIQNSNTSTTGAGTSANTNFLQQSPQKQQMQKLSTFTYTTNNNNNINNNNININDGNNKEHQISHVYGNMTTMGTGATTTVHVGPSGTTTVVEYNSNNKNNNKATIVHLNKQKLFGTTASSAPMANTTVTTTATSNNNHIFANTYNTSNINSIINNINNHNNKLTYITSSIATNNNSNNNNNNHNNGVGNFETINTMPQTAAINFVKSDNFAIISNSNNHNNPKTISYIQMSKPTNNNSTTTATTTNSSSSSTTTTTTTTTHHPHKKYLREKMCVFKEYNNNNNNNNNSETTTEDASTTTTTKIINYSHNNNNNNSVNSYTENNNNNCGIKILSTTTAAPTTSTPISSAFYNIIPNNNINIVNTPTNLSTTSLGSDTTPTTYLTLSSTTTGAASNSSNHDNISAYTILNSHQINNPSLLTLPESSVATLTTPSVVLSNNDYYNLTKINSDNNHNNKQPQVLPNNDILHQSEIQSLDLRSPTSYTSYDNDSVKDFETNIYVSQQQQQQPTASNKSAKSRGSNGGSGSNTPQKHKHPNNVPYDPLVHTHNKPPYSFSSLIFMAIEGSIEKALPVKEIYAWIVAHFPYFKTAPTGWKNSVRHNLSLNKSFVKVEKAPHMGKGSLWRVEPLQRQNLIQALTRSPFFPNSTVDKITIKNANTGIGLPDEEDSAPSSSHVAYEDEIIITKPTQSSSSVCGNSNATNINARFDPRLFPNLSKAFNEMTEHTVLNDVPDDEMPSDYSTNHNTNNNNTQQHLAQNKTDSYQLTLINNNNNNQHKKSTQINGFINDENILTTTSSAPETTKPVAPILLLNHFSSLEHLTRDCGADSMDDVNAATAMLALKHGPKIFSETFHNSSPVITSSPSEDHTYSAGGSSNAGSGASTPLMLTNNNNNSNTPLVIGINGNREQAQLQLLNGCDSQSNCASSEDAAYESSDELHNQVSMEELEDQQRHRDGVDALLSLSLSSSVLDSSPNTSSVSSAYSPIKRAYASSGVEDDHYNMMMNNIEPNNHNLSPKHSKTMFSGGNQQQQQQQHMYYDQGNVVKSAKHTYNGNEQQHQQHSQPKQFRQMQTPIQTQQLNAHGLSYLSPSPPKKSKQLRSLRTKIKRKSWLR